MKGLLVPLVIITMVMKSATCRPKGASLFQPPSEQRNYPNQLGAGISSCNRAASAHVICVNGGAGKLEINFIFFFNSMSNQSKRWSIIDHLQTSWWNTSYQVNMRMLISSSINISTFTNDSIRSFFASKHCCLYLIKEFQHLPFICNLCCMVRKKGPMLD